MPVRLERANLQRTYIWHRDAGDSASRGILDQIRVDKDEGYEVLKFIESIMNKHSLTTVRDVHRIEDVLHDPLLSSVDMRDDLEGMIEVILSLNE